MITISRKKKKSENKESSKKNKSMQDLFVDNCDLVEEVFSLMQDAVLSFLDENFEVAKEKTAELIAKEKAHDRLREEITSRLFTRETMAFSRSDRLKIVESLDKIVDKTEIAVRKLVQFPHSVDEELKKGIRTIAIKCKDIGKETKDLVLAVLEDFDQAKVHIAEITDIRRDVRELHWELLEKSYETHQKDHLALIHNQNLIRDLCKAADRAEFFADEIYSFICKYAL